MIRSNFMPSCETLEQIAKNNAHTTSTDKSKHYFPLAGRATDGYFREYLATATSFRYIDRGVLLLPPHNYVFMHRAS